MFFLVAKTASSTIFWRIRTHCSMALNENKCRFTYMTKYLARPRKILLNDARRFLLCSNPFNFTNLFLFLFSLTSHLLRDERKFYLKNEPFEDPSKHSTFYERRLVTFLYATKISIQTDRWVMLSTIQAAATSFNYMFIRYEAFEVKQRCNDAEKQNRNHIAWVRCTFLSVDRVWSLESLRRWCWWHD